MAALQMVPLSAGQSLRLAVQPHV
eukprot:SAG25_NODE_6321_length_569_cov_1.106383_1_plen_23_part_10